LHTGVFGDGRAEYKTLEHLVVVDGRILLKWALKRLEKGGGADWIHLTAGRIPVPGYCGYCNVFRNYLKVFSVP